MGSPMTIVPLKLRPETGPMRFAGDWTGYFMRGDDALGVAGELRAIADGIESGTLSPLVISLGLLRLAAKIETVKE